MRHTRRRQAVPSGLPRHACVALYAEITRHLMAGTRGRNVPRARARGGRRRPARVPHSVALGHPLPNDRDDRPRLSPGMADAARPPLRLQRGTVSPTRPSTLGLPIALRRTPSSAGRLASASATSNVSRTRSHGDVHDTQMTAAPPSCDSMYPATPRRTSPPTHLAAAGRGKAPLPCVPECEENRRDSVGKAGHMWEGTTPARPSTRAPPRSPAGAASPTVVSARRSPSGTSGVSPAGLQDTDIGRSSRPRPEQARGPVFPKRRQARQHPSPK